MRAVPGRARATATEFSRIGLPTPPNEPDWTRFVEQVRPELDVVFIITPHVFHVAQATACLEAGVDVLLEKPMVMNATEAEALIETRDRTGRLLVVAFPGSLSPQVRAAARMIASGEVGALLNIGADGLAGLGDCRRPGRGARTRRSSGGGFLFDTGAHMLNTVTDIAGEEFAQVAAWLEDDGRPVDIRGVVIARLASGALVTMNGCGRAIPGYRLGRQGLLRARDAPDRDLGRAPGDAEVRVPRACRRCGPCRRARSGSSSWRSAAAPNRTRARPRSA